ncbi:HNH-AP2 endonuclease II [Bacillus phage Slash]|uniref:HNH-AP2 endonuclease II n=3 Tax=Slashvirus TaxID=1921709 RepID=U5Q088_9CAUD|nr:HNH homing endonuclease II [Bacillus phage Staley]YP_008771965.1 HNH-AP2 endonuclease II [Bacillus phage Slash]YP_009203667.1 HNH homing endonuclease [Bacillus phage Stahl]AGY48352.1 HNH-AP2 endonuclease II [Bacillus phage Slash]AGY48748.1 HNH homing endonuclease II [Bacillus phage Staley]AKA61491.1 HNH homing endonuclease [Bacillus phage Stahl]
MHRTITLSSGNEVKVSECDFNYLNQYNWHETSNGYAVRNTPKGKVMMHREIMNFPEGKIVDHEDHDTLNNTRENLRVCSESQSQGNTRKIKVLSSKYKGVHFCKTKNTWIAKIAEGKTTKTIGYFNEEESAAFAYNLFAKRKYGEYAFLNDVPKEKLRDKKDIRKIIDKFTGTTKDVGIKQIGSFFKCEISFDKKKKFLGNYITKEEAIDTYNDFIREKGLNKPFNRKEVDEDVFDLS